MEESRRNSSFRQSSKDRPGEALPELHQIHHHAAVMLKGSLYSAMYPLERRSADVVKLYVCITSEALHLRRLDHLVDRQD